MKVLQKHTNIHRLAIRINPNFLIWIITDRVIVCLLNAIMQILCSGPLLKILLEFYQDSIVPCPCVFHTHIALVIWLFHRFRWINIYLSVHSILRYIGICKYVIFIGRRAIHIPFIQPELLYRRISFS